MRSPPQLLLLLPLLLVFSSSTNLRSSKQQERELPFRLRVASPASASNSKRRNVLFSLESKTSRRRQWNEWGSDSAAATMETRLLMEDIVKSAMSMSLPPDESTPSPPPTAKPTHAVSERDIQIGAKCGITAADRSRQIFEILKTVSPESMLLDPFSPRHSAFDWLDNTDEALLCPSIEARIKSRYMAALIYYGFRGDSWLNCAATSGDCVDRETMEPEVRFLSVSHECIWYGMRCVNATDVPDVDTEVVAVTGTDIADNNLEGEIPVELFSQYSQLSVLRLEGNRRIRGYLPPQVGLLLDLDILDLDKTDLIGDLPESLYDLTMLRALDLSNSRYTGTISSRISRLTRLLVLQLDDNNLEGPIPTDSFLPLTNLALLTLENNNLVGTMEPLCEQKPLIQQDFKMYLRQFQTDCAVPEGADLPQVNCSCCTGCGI